MGRRLQRRPNARRHSRRRGCNPRVGKSSTTSPRPTCRQTSSSAGTSRRMPTASLRSSCSTAFRSPVWSNQPPLTLSRWLRWRASVSHQITAPRSSPPQALLQGERPSPAGAALVPRKVSASIGFCCRAPLLFLSTGACGPSASPRNNSRRAWPPRRSWKSTPPLVAYAGARCQALKQPAPSDPAPRLSRTMLSTPLRRRRGCRRRTGATLPD